MYTNKAKLNVSFYKDIPQPLEHHFCCKLSLHTNLRVQIHCLEFRLLLSLLMTLLVEGRNRL